MIRLLRRSVRHGTLVAFGGLIGLGLLCADLRQAISQTYSSDAIYRGLVRKPPPQAPAIEGGPVIKGRPTIVQEPEPDPSVTLEILFQFGKSQLTNDGAASASSLGEAILRLPPQDYFQIAGHTDAVGSDEYNLRLSFARAQAVVDYLTHTFGIPRSRFIATGFGKRQLLKEIDATHEKQRRVVVINLGEAKERRQ